MKTNNAQIFMDVLKACKWGINVNPDIVPGLTQQYAWLENDEQGKGYYGPLSLEEFRIFANVDENLCVPDPAVWAESLFRGIPEGTYVKLGLISPSSGVIPFA